MLRTLMSLAAAIALASCSPAAGPTAEPTSAPSAPVMRVESLSVTPTPGGRSASAGYLTLRNSGGAPDTLVAIASPAAGRIDIHETRTNAQGVAQMFPIGSVAVPAGGHVTFAPGGLHLMLMDLRAPLAEGERIAMTFEFERSGSMQVEAIVARPAQATGGGAHGH